MNKLKGIAPIILAATLMLSSCIKKKDNDTNTDPARQHNEDVNNTKSESDNVNTDINNVLKDAPGFNKKEGTAAYNICGGTVDDSHQYDATPTLYINFDGSTACGSPARKRGGQIKLELVQGARWSDAGAVLRVTHINYKVTFVNLDNHYLVFNGIKYLTNMTQVNWGTYALTGNASLQVKERSYDMMVTFENGATESWNCARLTTVDITAYSTIQVTVNADTVMNGKNIDSWGMTRFNTNFVTEMITPWKSGTTCGWWRPTQGKYTSTTDKFTVTATAGVNQQGVPVTTGCGAYGYFLEWQYNDGTNTASGDLVINYF